MTNPLSRSARLACFLLLSLSTVACGDDAEDNEPAQSLAMLDPTGTHYGATYADWSVAWWQFFYGHPGAGHPILDATGDDCENGQSGDVFFLVGTLGGTAERSCAVPADKALFFPIVNATFDNAGVDEAMASSDDQLEANANDWLGAVVEEDLSLEVDGKSLTGLVGGKTGPTRFGYELPQDDNIYSAVGLEGLSGTIDPSFSAGYWVMLAPLAAGDHEIVFAGHVALDPDFRTEVTYQLTIE